MNNAFFRKLSRALRWSLSKAEAQEVLADFQDMQRQAAERGENFSLAEEKPWDIARSLRNPREYRRWLLMFGLLLLCPLVPLLYYLTYDFLPLANWDVPDRQTNMLFWPSLALALYWAHRCKTQQQNPPRSPRLLGGSLALALFNAFGCGSVCYWMYIIILNPEPWSNGRTGWLASNYIWFFCAVNLCLCLIGLLKSRLQSYRWLSLYILGITLLTCAMFIMADLRSMVLTSDHISTILRLTKCCLFYWLCGLAASLKIQI